MTLVVLGCGKQKRVEFEERKLWLGRCSCDIEPATACDLHRPEHERHYRVVRVARSFPLVDLYIGPLYTLRLAYARRLGGPHLIVSAFYGARSPQYLGVPYDRSLAGRRSRDPIRLWYDAVVRSTVLTHTRPGDRVVVLASRPYVEGWATEVRRDGRSVELPLEGMGMGQQLRWLRARLASPPPTPRPLSLRLLELLGEQL